MACGKARPAGNGVSIAQGRNAATGHGGHALRERAGRATAALQPWAIRAVFPAVCALHWHAPLALMRRYLLGTALTLLVFAMPPGAYAADGWFTTSDQQGMRAFSDSDYARAAELFDDPKWRAAALYRQGRFIESAEVLRGLNAITARYNRATALALAGSIETAIRLYEELLLDQPDHADARHNLEVLKQLLDPAPGVSGQPAETPAEALEDPAGQSEREQQTMPLAGDVELPEGELLPESSQSWLLQVPDDPGGLLRRKFLRQYRAEGVDQDGNPLWPGGEAEPW